MKYLKTKLIITFTILSIVFIIGYYTGYVVNKKPVQQTTVLKQIDKNDTVGLYQAYSTPIQIETKTDKNKIITTATDTYKQTVTITNRKMNTVLAGVIVGNGVGYELGFMRQLNVLPVSVGGSVLYFNGLMLSAKVSYDF